MPPEDFREPTQEQQERLQQCASNSSETAANAVDHPKHYNSHPSGVEAIDIVEHFNFNVGNAIKYLWRCGLKGDEIEDLKKAAWYVNREIERRLSGG